MYFNIHLMKNFITHKWILTIVFCFVSILSVFAQDNVIDEVVWVIGDEAILKSDIEQKKLLDLSEGRKFDGEPNCIVSEELAIQKLFMHQAALDSITVSDADIIPHLDAMEKEYIASIGSKEKLEEYFNMKLPQMREVWRENLRSGQTVQKMQQKIVGDIKVTPAEVREFYNGLPKDSIPFVPTEVEVQI